MFFGTLYLYRNFLRPGLRLHSSRKYLHLLLPADYIHTFWGHFNEKFILKGTWVPGCSYKFSSEISYHPFSASRSNQMCCSPLLHSSLFFTLRLKVKFFEIPALCEFPKTSNFARAQAFIACSLISKKFSKVHGSKFGQKHQESWLWFSSPKVVTFVLFVILTDSLLLCHLSDAFLKCFLCYFI